MPSFPMARTLMNAASRECSGWPGQGTRIEFEVVSIPGHSPAHIAYYTDGHLFSGDLLFAGSVGRVDIPGADWDTLLSSVRTLTDTYDRETIVYPGHGPTTTLGRELDRNPFLAELRS